MKTLQVIRTVVGSVSERLVQVHRLTAAAICASLGVNLQTWRERVLKEVHVEVILSLHGLLNAQLKNVGEVAGGIKPQINYRISNTKSEHKRKNREYTFKCQVSQTQTQQG